MNLKRAAISGGVGIPPVACFGRAGGVRLIDSVSRFVAPVRRSIARLGRHT